jgi:DNA-binding CsgD family transcriptional regulator
MAVDERVLQVVQSLYDAALDESLWPGTLKELTDLTGSQGASFWVLDNFEQIRLPSFTSVNFDPAAIQEYLEHLVPLDPTNQYLAAHPNEPIVHDGLFITEREKDRHPYYDWHDRAVGTRFRMVAQIRPAPGVQSGIALHRMPRYGRYEPADLEQFTFLYGHLKRALEVAFRLGSLGAVQQATAEVLDRNPAAIVLLDEAKRVVHANRRAEALRSNGDGIRLGADGIRLARKRDDDALQCLIARALSGIATPEDGPGGVMRAPRPSCKRAYAILVAPVAGRYPALALLRPGVCIVIADPEAQRALPADHLRVLFGLTEAEAKLAALLASGEELRTVAARLEITYGTARARLAAIFQKTQTRRQGELIRLVLTVCVL